MDPWASSYHRQGFPASDGDQRPSPPDPAVMLDPVRRGSIQLGCRSGDASRAPPRNNASTCSCVGTASPSCEAPHGSRERPSPACLFCLGACAFAVRDTAGVRSTRFTAPA